jgi:hypothetical protein
MKILFIALLLGTTGLISCKKRYTCECKLVSNGVVYDYVEIEKSKQKAIDDCNDLETSGATDCEIQ